MSAGVNAGPWAHGFQVMGAAYRLMRVVKLCMLPWDAIAEAGLWYQLEQICRISRVAGACHEAFSPGSIEAAACAKPVRRVGAPDTISDPTPKLTYLLTYYNSFLNDQGRTTSLPSMAESSQATLAFCTFGMFIIGRVSQPPPPSTHLPNTPHQTRSTMAPSKAPKPRSWAAPACTLPSAPA